MGSFYLILGLIFSLIIAIIAMANTEAVTVNYVLGRAEVSLILLILGSAFTGAVAMGLFSIFRSIRTALAFRELRGQQKDLQKQLKALEEEKVFLEASLNRAVSVPETDEESADFAVPAEEEVDEEPS